MLRDLVREPVNLTWRVSFWFVFPLFLCSTIGCGRHYNSLTSECKVALSSISLTTYDKYSSQFLDEATKHPTKNLGGDVVWGTRYYLESLITAFEATKNPKYIQAFEDTGASVMGLVETLHLLNVIDPSAPGQTETGPYIDVTGWPTYMNTFGASIAIPTLNGETALYAQSLYPRDATGPSSVEITAQSDGSLQFAWSRAGQTLQTYTLRSIDDLDTIAHQPLIYGQSLGRIKSTGAGLPALGSYKLDTPLLTIWHAEQTGGILLPFARFLLIAKDNPCLADPALVAAWQSMVLQIASSYEDHFTPDGDGGYTLHNPIWMAHTDADNDAPSDYVFAEVSLRILLYELTSDSNQLALARGLLKHQLSRDIPTHAKGWLVVREWPDIQPWTTRSEAPAGSIWHSLAYDTTAPEDSTEGQVFVEMLHIINSYGISSSLEIRPAFCALA